MNIVRELRRKAGIQQKELAIEIGVSSATVSNWENGIKDPTGDRLKKLARYFDVDELVVLGKGVVDLMDMDDGRPKTTEARFVSGCMDKMPKEERERAIAILQAAYPARFREEEDKIS